MKYKQNMIRMKGKILTPALVLDSFFHIFENKLVLTKMNSQ